MGYRLVIFPNLLTRVMVKAGLEALAALRAAGDSSGPLGRMLPFAALNAFPGLDECNALADRFTPKDKEDPR